jgi:hypothetical protein
MAFVVGGIVGLMGLIFHWPVTAIAGIALLLDEPERRDGAIRTRGVLDEDAPPG